MSLVFDIFQGIGVAGAVGVRPFLPAAVTGALAAGDVEITFLHTDFHFLQQPVFLAVMVVAALVFLLVDWRAGTSAGVARAVAGVLIVVALVIGALLCGGAIARGHHADWIGIVIGIACAAIGLAATWPFLARVRSRLGEEAGLLAVLTELAAAVAAGLSVVAPPIGVILVAALLYLLVAGRARGEQKYAGLRILR